MDQRALVRGAQVVEKPSLALDEARYIWISLERVREGPARDVRFQGRELAEEALAQEHGDAADQPPRRAHKAAGQAQEPPRARRVRDRVVGAVDEFLWSG